MFKCFVHITSSPENDQNILIVECNHQLFSELITTQKRNSHNATANSLYFPFHHAKLQILLNNVI